MAGPWGLGSLLCSPGECGAALRGDPAGDEHLHESRQLHPLRHRSSRAELDAETEVQVGVGAWPGRGVDTVGGAGRRSGPLAKLS